jgi:site-specific recombinase XerC
MLLTTQKQDLLKRLKCGHIRSVVNDVQVRMQQFLWWCNSDDMPHLLRHRFALIAAYHILISASMLRRCMQTGARKSLGHSARSSVLMCVLIVGTFLSGKFER